MTDWVAVFVRTKELLSGADYIYHGDNTHYPVEHGKCYCLWTASLDAYRDVSENESVDSIYDRMEDKHHLVNVLRQAIGLDPEDEVPNAGPVYAWNDLHTDEDVLAAADRAIELVTP